MHGFTTGCKHISMKICKHIIPFCHSCVMVPDLVKILTSMLRFNKIRKKHADNMINDNKEERPSHNLNASLLIC